MGPPVRRRAGATAGRPVSLEPRFSQRWEYSKMYSRIGVEGTPCAKTLLIGPHGKLASHALSTPATEKPPAFRLAPMYSDSIYFRHTSLSAGTQLPAPFDALSSLCTF